MCIRDSADIEHLELLPRFGDMRRNPRRKFLARRAMRRELVAKRGAGCFCRRKACIHLVCGGIDPVAILLPGGVEPRAQIVDRRLQRIADRSRGLGDLRQRDAMRVGDLRRRGNQPRFGFLRLLLQRAERFVEARCGGFAGPRGLGRLFAEFGELGFKIRALLMCDEPGFAEIDREPLRHIVDARQPGEQAVLSLIHI